MDWERIGMQISGKLYKSAFMKSTYERRTAHSVARNDKHFATFKAEQQRVISARILIRELFLEVGALHFVRSVSPTEFSSGWRY